MTRLSTFGLILVMLAVAPSALAAPTCLDTQGATVRCGAAGAMPVGWTPPAAPAHPDPSVDARGMLGLTAFLAGLFGLIALMPDFEGRWDRQADDDERR